MARDMITTATDVYLEAKKHRKYMELHVDKAQDAVELCESNAYKRFCTHYRESRADERYLDETYKTVKMAYQTEYKLDSHWNGNWEGDYKGFCNALDHKNNALKFTNICDAEYTILFHNWSAAGIMFATDVKKKTIALHKTAVNIEKAALDALADIIQLRDETLEREGQTFYV